MKLIFWALRWTNKTASSRWPLLKALCIFTSTVRRSSDSAFSRLFAAVTLMAASTKFGTSLKWAAFSRLARRTSSENGRYQAKNVATTRSRFVKNARISFFPGVAAKNYRNRFMKTRLILSRDRSTLRVWLKAPIAIWCQPLITLSTVIWYKTASRWTFRTRRSSLGATTAEYRLFRKS